MYFLIFVFSTFVTPVILLGQSVDLASNPLTNKAVSAAGYQITPGDLISVEVYGRPQLQRDSVRVEADGTIRLPLIDEAIAVACHSEGEVADQVATLYKKYLVEPHVSVSVKEFNSQPVELMGAVNRPGPFQLQRKVQLRELLVRAGGLSAMAGQTIQVIHDETLPYCDERVILGSTPVVEPVPFISLPASEVMGGSSAFNPWIRPGDLINVPDAELIYVVGNVVRPASMPLTQDLTLTRAIALAGGVLPASKDSVRVLRSTEKGMNKELEIDIREIAEGSAMDMTLVAGDIVSVQISQGKQLLKGAISAITSMGPIYYPLTVIQ